MYTRKTTGLFEIRHFKFCNVTLTYIDDVVSINDPNFPNWISLIYTKELEVNEITVTASSYSFIDIHLKFDSSGKLSTRFYDFRDDFKLAIIHFPHLDSSIPTVPFMEFIFHNSRL
jgi:hypothetical protein